MYKNQRRSSQKDVTHEVVTVFENQGRPSLRRIESENDTDKMPSKIKGTTVRQLSGRG